MFKEDSVKKLDNMIEQLEGETGAAPLRCDPDDPWYSEGLVRSTTVSKVHCKQCGYYYTLPFEKVCPICEFTTGKKHEPKFHLDVEAIRNVCKPTGEKKGDNKEEKHGKGNGKEEGASSSSGAAAPKKGPQAPKQASEEELNTCFSHAFFQIARLNNCYKHPDADKLIVTEADLGNNEKRTLVTGLIPFYQPADLEGKLVCVVKNLKPKKMKNIEGSVMLLAATDSATKKIVVLSVPEGSVPGDRVFPEHFPLLKHIVDKSMSFDNKEQIFDLFAGGTGAEMTEIPKKQFEKIVAGFQIHGEKPNFYNKPLMTARGYLTAPGVADGSEFH